MKVALISDIHGNAIALEKVLADIEKRKVDKIYVLGDLCYRGPEPKRSLQLIRSLGAEVLKGNADEWVVRGVRQGEVPDRVVEIMNREREWTVSQLDQTDIDYLRGLPEEIRFDMDGSMISLFHAVPGSLFDIVPPHAEDASIKSRLMSAADAQLYAYGHIHKAYIRYIDGRAIINTGSVGLPFDGLALASYAIVEIAGGCIRASIERVSYPLERTAELYMQVNYPNADMMIKVLRSASL